MTLEDIEQEDGDEPGDATPDEGHGCNLEVAGDEDAAVEQEDRYLDGGYGEGVGQLNCEEGLFAPSAD